MTTVAVIGPGAIGCAVAGALSQRDHALAIGARRRFDRLVVMGEGVDIDAAVDVETTPPDRSTPVEVVLLTTKTFQTEGARGWFDAFVGPDTLVAVLQNGVEHEERVRPLVGDKPTVVPVVVMIPAQRDAPGEVSLAGAARLAVARTDVGERFASLFADTYVTVDLVDDWHTVAWLKLLGNCALGAITTLTRRSNAVVTDPDATHLALDLLREVAEVARAEGADVDDDAAQIVLDAVIARAGDHTSSITVDRLAGRPTEWRARNDVVVRKAAMHGIDVPLNRAMTTLLRLGEPATVTVPGR